MEAERPIFLMPQMLIFWHLAEQLGANQSVYALQLLDEDVPPRMESASFEELATLYYNLIREVQPEGPYRLGGWCLWGLMAYEVARLLEQGGAEVDLVMIIDTWAPGAWTGHSTPRRLGLIAAHLWHRLRWIAARVLRGSGEKRRRDLLRGLRVVIEPLAPWLPERLRVNRPVTELGRLERLVSDAAASYEPGPLKGKVLLFKGEQRAAGTSFGEDMGWTRVLGRYVAMNELPGDHSEIFELPGAQIMAARVREALGLEMEP